MENEIKVGDWIRTKDGKIGTIKHKSSYYENDKFVRNEYRTSFNIYYYTDKQMKECGWKIKSNLIDIIEVGDYVNGILVTGKESTLLWTEIKGIDRSGYHIPISQYGENIKSVVTKEQFESISYKVKQEEK